MKYNLIACGGTFDLLHKGHKEFLKKILVLSDKVILGMTSDKYVFRHKPNKGIASFITRKKRLVNFLKEIGAEKRVKIVKIDNMFGPLLNSQFAADGLAVVPQLRKNAEYINMQRINHGLKPLKILELPQKIADDGKAISSSRIREGEIDREGKLRVVRKVHKV